VLIQIVSIAFAWGMGSRYWFCYWFEHNPFVMYSCSNVIWTPNQANQHQIQLQLSPNWMGQAPAERQIKLSQGPVSSCYPHPLVTDFVRLAFLGLPVRPLQAAKGLLLWHCVMNTYRPRWIIMVAPKLTQNNMFFFSLLNNKFPFLSQMFVFLPALHVLSGSLR
jgi:hypothetical protein